jgi:hypothetical protein
MRRVRENGLSIAFGLLFLASLAGQAIAGHDVYNDEQLQHDEQPVGFARYLVSSHFGNAVMENWQSEYLQFTLFVFMTIWFIQRGSPESKEPGKEGLESDSEQKVGRHADERSPRWARYGDWRTTLYSNSLLIVMVAIWLGSWFAQSVTGWNEFNSQQTAHDEPTIGWLGFIGTSDFWEATLQNWQSEFLAVGSFTVFTVFLRQRGSPESKPVGAPIYDATGQEG